MADRAPTISTEETVTPAAPAEEVRVDPLRRARWRNVLVASGTIGAILGGAMAVGCVLHVLLARDLLYAALCLQTLLAIVAVWSSGWAAVRQWKRWSQPTRQLELLVPGARMGEIPIDELSKVGGGLAPLAGHIQELLRDLRAERCAVSRLNEEIRQRVAVRTESLERTIGSLRQQATRDKLTGLYNRRMFDESLKPIVEKCRDESEELTLLIGDVDYFKKLNDTLGHADGDKFLREIGQLIRSTIGADDMGFRLGGDEFVILMPRSARRPGEEMAQRLISLVDQLARPLKLDTRPRISFGIATLSALPDPSGEQLLKVADEQLYEQKALRKSHLGTTTPHAA